MNDKTVLWVWGIMLFVCVVIIAGLVVMYK